MYMRIRRWWIGVVYNTPGRVEPVSDVSDNGNDLHREQPEPITFRLVNVANEFIKPYCEFSGLGAAAFVQMEGWECL